MPLVRLMAFDRAQSPHKCGLCVNAAVHGCMAWVKKRI